MGNLGTAALIAGLAWSTAGVAQQTPQSDPAAVSAARNVVMKMQGDRATVLQSMAAPLAGLITQMGVKEPDRAQTLVREVVVPTLAAHYDEVLDVQVQALATSLSAADLQATAAFYDSPAGKNFASAQPKLAQAQLTGMSQWLAKVAPEIQTKLAQAIQKHGWNR